LKIHINIVEPCKEISKISFGENIVYPARICQNGFYWRITIFLKARFGCPGKITFLY